MKKRLKVLIPCFILVIVFAAFCGKFGGVFMVSQAETEEAKEPVIAGESAEAPTAEEAEQHGLYETPEARIATMKKIASEGGKELYFDNSYGEIAVVDTQTKETWFSTPYNYNSDIMASDDVKALLASMVRITYYDKQMTELKMNSYTDCVAKAAPQFTTEEIENGIRINMQIGLVETKMLLPDAAEASRFEEKVISKLSEKDARKINVYYTKISLSDPSLGEKVKKDYQENYPGLLEKDFYVLRNVSDREKRLIEKIIKTTEYTLEDYEDDLDLSGYVSEEGVSALFNMSVEFSLQDGDLIVNVPTERISYDREEFVLSKIILCEFFGAGYSRSDGYLFVPDGSGTLIKYNTQREKSILYTTNTVYGDDYALTNQWAYNSLDQQIYFPVYGNKESNKAIFAILEEGDAMAKIISESGNILSSYETVYPEFNYATTYTVNYQDETKMRGMYTYHDRNYYDGNYRVRFKFLTGDAASYVGMAKCYQDYLVKKGAINKLNNESADTPLYLETLGTIYQKDTFLGFSYDKAVGMTSFEEAKDILSDMKDQGMEHINLRLKGWMNGGMDYTVSDHMKLESNLGGKKGFKELLEFTKENKIGLFPEVDFNLARKNEMFDGYSESLHAPRTLSRETAYLITPQEITNLAFLQFMFYSVSPNRYNENFKDFFRDYNKLNAQGVSIGNAGTMLYSDFKKSDPVNRQQAMGILQTNLDTYCSGQKALLTDGGNAYTLPYTKDIVNVPMTDSSYTLADESIPFMQLVLHGYVNYAGDALNLSSNVEDYMLKSLEYGSNLFFTVAYKNAKELKETPYSYYYTIDYTTWKQSIVEHYNKFNEVYGKLQDQAMVDHIKLDDQVYQTTYEDGTKIIVNYNEKSVTVNDTTVEAKSFVVVK